MFGSLWLFFYSDMKPLSKYSPVMLLLSPVTWILSENHENEKWEQNLTWTLALSVTSFPIGHFTVKDGSEGEGDLVLIQTFFALLWKLFLKNTSNHKNNLIYIIKLEGLYQNKVTLSLASIHNCKMAYSLFFPIFIFSLPKLIPCYLFPVLVTSGGH